jgi:hypothetical protein
MGTFRQAFRPSSRSWPRISLLPPGNERRATFVRKLSSKSRRISTPGKAVATHTGSGRCDARPGVKWRQVRRLLCRRVRTLLGRYTAQPAGIQIVFYVATLVLIGSLMRLFRARPAAVERRQVTP